MNGTPPPRRRPAWLAGLACAIVLTLAIGSNRFPYLPRPLALAVTFPPGIPGRIEPLLSTGVFERADFLSVKYLSETTAVLIYDCWGPGGPTSDPFTFQPRHPHALVVDMPALDYGGARLRHERRTLRVTFDGRELVNAPVVFYARRPENVYFGCNPIGGNNSGAIFRGMLATSDGRILQGGPGSYFPLRVRLREWATHQPLQLLLVLLASVSVGWLTPPISRALTRRAESVSAGAHLAGGSSAPHLTFALASAACVLAFTTLITQGTFHLFVEEPFGTFYDYQAASFLHGRLDVPEAAIGGEAFVVDGKYYGYFGITPAVLRLPFAASGVAFGQLSRGLMLLYFIACLGAAYALLCQGTRIACGRGVWPSRWAVVVFTLSVGLGSTLFFLGARAYVYHEAILCGAAFALWSAYLSLRWLEAIELAPVSAATGAPAAPTELSPGRPAWIGALACGVAAVHARPPAGLFALAVLGCAALWVFHRRAEAADPAARGRTAVVVALLAALGLASFNGLSYLKFRTWDGSPLRYSVQYTPERRAHFDDRNFHAGNLSHNVDAYLLRPDFHLEPRFPYFFFGVRKGRYYPEARIDLEEPTLAFPYAMPALFALALGGGLWAFVRVPRLRAPLASVVVGAQPMALALSTAIVTSHRYTGDFCPLLIVCAACGLAVIDAERVASRRLLRGATSALVLVSIFITVALSLQFQGEMVWGVSDEGKQHYQQLRQHMDQWLGSRP